MNILKSAVMDKFKLYFKNHSEEIAMVLYSMNPNAGNWLTCLSSRKSATACNDFFVPQRLTKNLGTKKKNFMLRFFFLNKKH